MKTRRFAALWLSLPIMLIAFAAQAQTIPFDLEIGYRSLDLSGNRGMYRTQINERDGFLIRNFTLATSDFEGHVNAVDRFRIDISDLGVGPAGSARLEASRQGMYRLRFGYRAVDAFSALPAFANPLLGQGVVPGQHTYSRIRRMFDADLELMPDRAITPFIGFTRNENHGPGQTTYHAGQDEFRLSQDLHERDHEIRGGASFRFRSVYGQLTQGWRSFRGTDSLTLAPGAGAGNNPGPVLGNPVTAGSLTRLDRTSVDTPFTSFFITAQAHQRVRLIGNYVRFAADSSGTENEDAAGSFASFALSRFFSGISESGSSSAKNDTWRGGGRAEVTILPNLEFLGGFQREHRELNGTALIDTVFLQTITFAGFDPRDIETVLRATSSASRDEDVLNAGLSARAVGPFAFRAEFRETKQDVSVAPDLAEIVVPGSQGGDFARRINTFDVNGSYSQSGLLLGAAWRRDSANKPVFRTDYLDRDRLRARAAWSTPGKLFRAGITAERTNQSNDRQDTGYDARMRQFSGDLEVAPVKALRLHASISQFRADSSISFRRPENFNIDQSVQKENGRAHEGGLMFVLGPFSSDLSVGRFENEGTTPFSIDRDRLRLSWDFKSRAGLSAEWNRDKYDEPSPSWGDFEANRYGLYLRWRP